MGKYCRQHIGETFNDGKLIVVDGGDRRSHVKVKCSVCEEDTELFGDGIFEVNISNLNTGKIPCGCASNINWTLAQYKIRINRKISEGNLPIKFIRFAEIDASPSRTPLTLFCNKTQTEYEVRTVTAFFLGTGNQGKVYTVDERIYQYNIDHPTYTVWDSGKVRSNSNVVCGFHCKICEGNGFESLFEIDCQHLFAGTLPCHCGNRMNVLGSHIVEMTARKLNEQREEGISVIGAVKKGAFWHSVFLCGIHGMYSRAYRALDETGCYCLKCDPPKAGYNKNKQGYLYILDIQTNTEIILGYGITNNIDTRISSHRTSVFRIGATITNIQVFEGSGTAILAVENAIKALHTTGLIDCEGFRRESISFDMKDKVLEKCSKLKVLDNVNKLL